MSNGAGRDDIEHVLSKGYPGARPPEFSGGASAGGGPGALVVSPEPTALAVRPSDAMQLGLSISTVVLTLGVVLQLLVAIWLVSTSLITASAGTLLIHSGSLESAVLASCTKTALGIDVILFLVIGGAKLWCAIDRPAQAPPPSVYARYPVMWSSLGLLAALGAVSVLAASTSWSGVHRLATTVVLTSAYFFTLIAAIYLSRTAYAVVTGVKRWTLASAYRTGACTMLFIFLGFGGLVLRKAGWYEAPLAELEQEVELYALRTAVGPLEFQQAALCLGSNEVLEAGAAGTSPPACAPALIGASSGGNGAPPSGDGERAGKHSDGCFETLFPRVANERAFLRSKGLGPYDADDFAMEALVITCTRDPLPDELFSYFHTVAVNQGKRDRRRSERTPPCGEWSQDDAAYTGYCTREPEPARQDALLEAFWQSTLCGVDDVTADVLHSRLHDGLSYREVGRRAGMTEAKARDTFHNAIKKFRKRSAGCNPLWE